MKLRSYEALTPTERGVLCVLARNDGSGAYTVTDFRKYRTVYNVPGSRKALKAALDSLVARYMASEDGRTSRSYYRYLSETDGAKRAADDARVKARRENETAACKAVAKCLGIPAKHVHVVRDGVLLTISPARLRSTLESFAEVDDAWDESR